MENIQDNQLTLSDLALKLNWRMRLLRLDEWRLLVAGSDKGNLFFTLRKGGEAKDFRFVLDAVPVDLKTNEKLLTHFDGELYKL